VDANERYAEVTKRLAPASTAGATLITALTIAGIWGDWRGVAFVLGLQVALLAFNIWITLVYLPRKGRRAETLRAVVNLAACVVLTRAIGWPLAIWLWLPYVALTFDHLDPRVARGVVLAMCLVFDGLALYDGVDWVYPVVFTALALFCSEMSRVRFAIIRDMLMRSEQQRTEVQAAHASVASALARLEDEVAARQRAEIELRQAQKLEAIGRLASGVAHEINTPVQFVNDSATFVRTAFADLVPVIRAYQRLRQAVDAGEDVRARGDELARLEEAADVEYALENVPPALERALEGLGRVAGIVRSLKDFAHADRKEMIGIDLNQAIMSTLTISKHEYKMVADVETELATLPLVTCHPGEVNQVLLNLLVNAAHAIGDAVAGSDRRGVIRVRSGVEGHQVVVSISDTGPGIPPAIRERIFEPFFTTKEVGKGTGQGLAISRSLVEKHGGKLTFESPPSGGATFFVRLPLVPTHPTPPGERRVSA
jgi:signal transduction histidine kinase